MLSETGLELGESYKVLYSFAIISCRMNNLMTSDSGKEQTEHMRLMVYDKKRDEVAFSK